MDDKAAVLADVCGDLSGNRADEAGAILSERYPFVSLINVGLISRAVRRTVASVARSAFRRQRSPGIPPRCPVAGGPIGIASPHVHYERVRDEVHLVSNELIRPIDEETARAIQATANFGSKVIDAGTGAGSWLDRVTNRLPRTLLAWRSAIG
jgi:hypothetical protein